MFQVNCHYVLKQVPILVFDIIGDIDGSKYEEFQKQVSQEIERGARYLLLDLSRVSYVSSAGLRALMFIANQLSCKNDGVMTGGLHANTFKSPCLKLLAPPPSVQKTMQMVGFHMLFEIFDNLDRAIESYGSQEAPA